MNRPSPFARRATAILGVAGVYFAAAELGLSLAYEAPQVSPVWPPTGISLAAVFLLGRWVWPGIALGALAANLASGAPLLAALGIATGNTLEALVGAALLQRVGFRPALSRMGDVLALTLLAAGASTVVSATIGVTSLCATGVEPWSDFGPLWRVWWLGDAMGDLVVAPLLLVWISSPPRRWPAAVTAESAALAAATVFGSLVIFVVRAPWAAEIPREYAVFPLLIWAALRFGQRGTSGTIAAISAIAIWGTASGRGPFRTGLPLEGLVMLQDFLGVAAITAFFLGAAVVERNRADRRRAAAYAAAVAVAEPGTLQEIAPRMLRPLCEHLGWREAELWAAGPTGALRRLARWPGAPGGEGERASAVPADEVRAARESGEVRWSGDAGPTSGGHSRATVLAFPVVASGEVLGVVGLWRPAGRPPDRGLLRAASDLGSQLGELLERRRAQEALRLSEERLRLALEAARLGVWDWNVVTGEVRWSENLEPIHGLPPDAFAGTVEAFRELVHPEDRERVGEAIRRALEEGEPYDVEFRNVWPDGSVHWVAAKGRVLGDAEGRPTRMLGTGMDVTERHRLEDDLRERARQLGEADRRKDEFLAMLAHELRNPLAPIRYAAELLRLGGQDETTAAMAREVLDRQIGHLVRLVDELLDISRIQRGKIELQRRTVSLSEVVQAAVETARPWFDAKLQQLVVALPEQSSWVDADPMRLAQAFSNLLNNASKYSPSGARVWITAAREGDEAVVRVRDEGAGMEPETLGAAFELFTQGPRPLDRGQSGLGIGLTVVKSVVELHGGSVAAASAGPGHGSEFSVWLPAVLPRDDAPRPREAEAVARTETAPGGEGVRRVLVVEDNLDAAEGLARLLATCGHEVRVAHDGPEALRIAAEFAPQTVLLDIGLPGLDGYAVARELRRDPRLAATRVVAVTGYGRRSDRERSREAGIDAHLVKPVDLETLRGAIG